ncbi:hypothetical protein A3B42_04205 [Candidatus Daviesbacteria bacterium RIFCSPLOWO2_01_FULL_38_10]|uniref:Uncharacterized protein n=1 Tax=Candidatus Daviesbacteria bacterium GW2011_GWF2_38_6 TaxID=1618432 RepID=A0A0G0KTY5_9BACT|nr:MAG: hypothetical protein US80_C0003G0007 [Candidatus Daviesbacteria bacterium GW2011_GWA2_38_17]KKQ79015.1 MAG: hypothetical protein US99_C0005G0007 [Candidatus Daviesbacteria bacterium GW2011_GWF2_38_6]OGE26077.1 MAG: hypothetical protein A3D02_03545 [Candidatus Daviesbacteria bacterium RIFCSPHIGHO2_02_FULL_39_41]OGE29604.1 MAG: hypothetical protein A2772_02275 [Candidatus Daviesbacteria bacterium RIFCSPHIGHO2_01_FULL_38_8b]OGE40314.1 MAG: hypothetical protein A3B42_04205 [Candidatus Davie
MLIKGPKLLPTQWKLLASATSNIGQAIILFGLAAMFVPEALNLGGSFSKEFAVIILIGGLLFLIGAVIISKRGR